MSQIAACSSSITATTTTIATATTVVENRRRSSSHCGLQQKSTCGSLDDARDSDDLDNPQTATNSQQQQQQWPAMSGLTAPTVLQQTAKSGREIVHKIERVDNTDNDEGEKETACNSECMKKTNSGSSNSCKKYVETSLDNLSYLSSSSTTSSSCSGQNQLEENVNDNVTSVREICRRSDDELQSRNLSASNQSDKDEEKRILLKLQEKQRQQLKAADDRELQQQQKLNHLQNKHLHQQQQPQQQQVQVPLMLSSGDHQEYRHQPRGLTANGDEDDEAPPEVPVRRSSQQASKLLGRRLATGAGVSIGTGGLGPGERPQRPPPPPPPPRSPDTRLTRALLQSAAKVASPPPLPPPPLEMFLAPASAASSSRRSRPKDVWSPATTTTSASSASADAESPQSGRSSSSMTSLNPMASVEPLNDDDGLANNSTSDSSSQAVNQTVESGAARQQQQQVAGSLTTGGELSEAINVPGDGAARFTPFDLPPPPPICGADVDQISGGYATTSKLRSNSIAASVAQPRAPVGNASLSQQQELELQHRKSTAATTTTTAIKTTTAGKTPTDAASMESQAQNYRTLPTAKALDSVEQKQAKPDDAAQTTNKTTFSKQSQVTYSSVVREEQLNYESRGVQRKSVEGEAIAASDDELGKPESHYGDPRAVCSKSKQQAVENLADVQMAATSARPKDQQPCQQQQQPTEAGDWFKQMYREMHKATPERHMLDAVHSKQDQTEIKVKLKSPKNDHHFSPTYYTNDEFEHRTDRGSKSPTFRPGNIAEFVPGGSSITQHERNLQIYYRLIEHIDQVFSSVLPEVSSTSNTFHCSRKSDRYQRKRQAKSGPQTPSSSFNRRTEYRHERLKGDDTAAGDTADPHESRCAFSKLISASAPTQHQYYNQLDDDNKSKLEDFTTTNRGHEHRQNDAHKQYVAVQHGHDIPLQGLRKPAPTANIYKVGPAPLPIWPAAGFEPVSTESCKNLEFISNSLAPKQNGDATSSTESNNHKQVNDATKTANIPSRSSRARSSSPSRPLVASRAKQQIIDSWSDDIFHDFDIIYESMKGLQVNNNSSSSSISTNYRNKRVLNNKFSSQTTPRNMPLRSFLAPNSFSTDIGNAPSSTNQSLLGYGDDSFERAILTQSPSDRMNDASSPRTSPVLSIGASTSDLTRADSRNTNQSYQTGAGGPALVEEMTLSDLEDEISSAIICGGRIPSAATTPIPTPTTTTAMPADYQLSAADGEQMVRSMRSRAPIPASISRLYATYQLQPAPVAINQHAQKRTALSNGSLENQLFADDLPINIHYKTPTSKLLKMNTFNEFELNRLKRLYRDEFESRLQRSRSTRLGTASERRSQSQGRAQDQPDDQHWRSAPSIVRPSCVSSQQTLPLATSATAYFPGYEASQSAENLAAAAEADLGRALSPFVDPLRYERAFTAKSTGPSRRRWGGAARFGRALFDFQAKSERELSLKRGDLVELLEFLDHTWTRVEDCQSGLQGLVPLNYIDYSVGCAVAKRDISAHERVVRPDGRYASTMPLLQMNKGEPITLLRRLSGAWYEASNTRRLSGLVWSKHLDIIKQPVLRDDDGVDDGESFNLAVAGGVDLTPERRRPRSAHFSSDLKHRYDDDDEVEPDNNLHYQHYRNRDYESGGDDAIYVLESGERVLATRPTADAGGDSWRSSRRRNQPLSERTKTASKSDPRCLCCASKFDAIDATGVAEEDFVDRERARRARLQTAPRYQHQNQHQHQRHQHHQHHQHQQHQHQQQRQATNPRRSSSSPYISAENETIERLVVEEMRTAEESFKRQQLQQRAWRSQAPQTTNKHHHYQHHHQNHQLKEMAPPPQPPSSTSATQTVGGGSQLPPQLYQVRHAYKPNKADEIELIVGDIITVLHKCDDGWFVGTSSATKQCGTFPGNFVHAIVAR